MCVRWNTRPLCLSFHQYCNLRTGSAEIQDSDRFCVNNNNTALEPFTSTTAPDTSLHSSQTTFLSRTPINSITCHSLCHFCLFYRPCLLFAFAHLSPARHSVKDFRSFTVVLHAASPCSSHYPHLSRARSSSCPLHSRLPWFAAYRELLPFIHCYASLHDIHSPAAQTQHSDCPTRIPAFLVACP